MDRSGQRSDAPNTSPSPRRLDFVSPTGRAGNQPTGAGSVYSRAVPPGSSSSSNRNINATPGSSSLRFDLERMQHKLQEKDRDLDVLRFGKQIAAQKLELAKSQQAKLEERLKREKKAHEVVKTSNVTLRQTVAEKEKIIRQLQLQSEHATHREGELAADVAARDKRIAQLQSSLELAESSHRPHAPDDEALRDLEDKLGRLHAQVVQKSSELATERQRTAKLKKQEEALVSDLDHIRADLRREKEECSQIARTNEDLQDRISELEERLVRSASGGQEFGTPLQSAEPLVEQLEDERRKNNSLTSRISTLQQELAASRKSFEMMMGERKGALNAKDRAEEELRVYRSTHEHRLQELEGERVSLETRSKDLASRCTQAEDKWLQSERQVAVLVARNNQLVVLSDDATAKHERLRSQVSEVEGRYKGQLSLLQEECDRMREANREYVEANKEVEGTVRVLQEQLHTKSADCVALESRIAHLEKKLRQTELRADSLQKENVEWQKANEALSSNLQNSLAQNNALESSKMDIISRLSTSFSLSKKALQPQGDGYDENSRMNVNTIRTADALQEALDINDVTQDLIGRSPAAKTPSTAGRERVREGPSNSLVVAELKALKELVKQQAASINNVNDRLGDLKGDQQQQLQTMAEIKDSTIAVNDKTTHNYRALDNVTKAVQGLRSELLLSVSGGGDDDDDRVVDANVTPSGPAKSPRRVTPVQPQPFQWTNGLSDPDSDKEDDGAPAGGRGQSSAPGARTKRTASNVLQDTLSEFGSEEELTAEVIEHPPVEEKTLHIQKMETETSLQSPQRPVSHHSRDVSHSSVVKGAGKHMGGLIGKVIESVGAVQQEQEQQSQQLQELLEAVKEIRDNSAEAKNDMKEVLADVVESVAERVNRMTPEQREQMKQLILEGMSDYYDDNKDQRVARDMETAISNIVSTRMIENSQIHHHKEVIKGGNNNMFLILGIVGVAMAGMYTVLTHRNTPAYYTT